MSGPFDLPPDDATPSQLLQLIREQRNSNDMLAHRMDIMAEKFVDMSDQLKVISADTKGLKMAFGTARSTLSVLKWAAALAGMVIAIVEGIRRMAS